MRAPPGTATLGSPTAAAARSISSSRSFPSRRQRLLLEGAGAGARRRARLGARGRRGRRRSVSFIALVPFASAARVLLDSARGCRARRARLGARGRRGRRPAAWSFMERARSLRVGSAFSSRAPGAAAPAALGSVPVGAAATVRVAGGRPAAEAGAAWLLDDVKRAGPGASLRRGRGRSGSPSRPPIRARRSRARAGGAPRRARRPHRRARPSAAAAATGARMPDAAARRGTAGGPSARCDRAGGHRWPRSTRSSAARDAASSNRCGPSG